MAEKFIAPRKLAGFWELTPEKQFVFDEMQNKIKKVFEKNCYVPLDTPVLELAEVLLAKSGGEMDKEIYAFSKGSTNMCMRYDFTVPLARFVSANYNTLEFPFKRYQIGKNYRGEKPQKGRWREFYQCDADIIGNENLPLVADAECVKLYDECFKELGYETVVEISNRNLLVGLIESCDDNDKMTEIITTLDKFDKIGEQGVSEIFKELNLKEENIKKYLSAIKIKGDFEEVYNKLTTLNCENEIFLKGLNDLKELEEYILAFGVDKNCYIYNLGIIRGHNYYTGTVFEVYLKNARHFGALGGGGRYDNLAGYFTDKKLPGVGMSIGLTRLFDLFDQNGLLPQVKKSCIDVLVIPLGDYTKESISICEELRNNNFKSEIAYDNRSFKSKMKEADRREIPYVIIVGENEVLAKQYAFKDMKTGTQENLTIEQIISKLK